VRWWTRERLNDPDFDDWDAVSADYWKHVAEIRTELPVDLALLLNQSQRFSLHDSHIEMAMLDLVGRRARIQFRTYDAILDCNYYGADFGESNLRDFEMAVEALLPKFDSTSPAPIQLQPLSTVLHDEVTTAGEGRYRHAILIDPLGDISIDFDDFRLVARELPATTSAVRKRTWLVNEWSTREEIADFGSLIAPG
jgi:hypothetical protein